jgi:glycerol-3-phosphate acyltransferase PlsX
MGGDFAPVNEIEGALLAALEKTNELEVYVVGKTNTINEILKKKNSQPDNLFVVNADDVISMEDSPLDSYKSKPNSSLNVSLGLQKDKEVDAVISIGNTGAVLAHSVLRLGRIEGINRPTIGAMFPAPDGNIMVFDVGASVDCRANHLYEYALMGSIFFSHIFNVKNPKVGLLNIGEEKTKGNELTVEAYKLLENSKLNFIGNIEGRDILFGKADIVVCDGFLGNVLLKFAESILGILKARFRTHSEKNIFNKVWVGMMYGTLKKILADFDYQYHGGVPLLGINGVCIIGHGKSTPLAVKNMIFRAMEVVKKDVNKKIQEGLSVNS